MLLTSSASLRPRQRTWGRPAGGARGHRTRPGRAGGVAHAQAPPAAGRHKMAAGARGARLGLGLLLVVLCGACGAAGPGSRPAKKKDVRDYNDADMARLLEQWEVRAAPAMLSDRARGLFPPAVLAVFAGREAAGRGGDRAASAHVSPARLLLAAFPVPLSSLILPFLLLLLLPPFMCVCMCLSRASPCPFWLGACGFSCCCHRHPSSLSFLFVCFRKLCRTFRWYVFN